MKASVRTRGNVLQVEGVFFLSARSPNSNVWTVRAERQHRGGNEL